MAQDCCSPISGNIVKVCGAKRGGMIKCLYAVSLCNIDKIDVDSTTGEVIDISMKAQPSPATTDYFWYEIGVKKNTHGFTNTATINDGGSKYFEQAVSFSIEGFDQPTKNAFNDMIDGEAVFIGISADGNAHVLGRLSGAEMTEGTIGTGVAVSDLFGGTATFTAQEIEVTPSIIMDGSITIEVQSSAEGATAGDVITVTFD